MILLRGYLAFTLLTFGLTSAAPLDDSQSVGLDRRQTGNASRVAFYPPASGGGSYISQSREPINMIVSALSTPSVLTPFGFLNFAQYLNFSTECLGGHLGGYMQANLGDGSGFVPQTGIYREDFGDHMMGTCLESLNGGNHFRFWIQNGTSGNSGAYFIAASVEFNATLGHLIVPDGYNLGRDRILAAVRQLNDTAFNGVRYTTRIEMLTGQAPAGAGGINGAGINHNISIDGTVALLTVIAAGEMANIPKIDPVTGQPTSGNGISLFNSTK